MSLASRQLIQAAAGAGVDTGDDDFANVVLLLDGDGTSGDNNEAFTDSGSVGATITENGDVIQGSFSPYGDNWSVYFDGSGYLDTASGATALGTGAFTVEFWINTTDTSFNIMNPDSSTGNGFWGLMVQSGDLRWNNQYALTNLWVVDGAPILDGQWHHVAIVSSSSVFKVFYDGVSQSIQSGSFNDSYNYPYNDGLRIGSGNLATFKGYLSNIRLVSGTAIYSSDFHIPTAPFTNSTSYTEKLLACQSNRFIDNGNSEYAITTSGTPKVTPFSPFKNDDARDITTDGGSALFGSSGDYLQLPSNSAYNATSSLCVECWFYMVGAPGSGPSAHCPLSRWNSTTLGQRSWFFDIENSGIRMRVDTAANGANVIVADNSTGALDRYAWYHIALTWDGSTYRGFLNGELIGSLSDSNAPRGTSQAIRVGYNLNSHYMDGYVSDCRVLVDQGAVYTSAFTPPTAPLGNFGANTPKLLLNFQDAGIYDRSGINNIDTVGNAQIDTAVKKYGTGSIQFDGTGDYLTFDSQLNELSFGTGDFTIEGWFYIQSGDEYPYALDFRSSSSQAAPALYFYNYGNGSIDYYVSGSSRILGTSAGNDVWQHIAVCRSGTSTKMFVNGTQSGSTYTDSTNYAAYSGSIGNNYSNGRPFKGFIDDFRITKGVARYPANFTAPDRAHPSF